MLPWIKTFRHTPVRSKGPFANLHVFRDAVFIAKALVGQGNGFSNERLYQQMKALVAHIQGIPIPGHHAAKAVHQPTKLDVNTPAALVFAFLPDLL